jgi:hypothetical protein
MAMIASTFLVIGCGNLPLEKFKSNNKAAASASFPLDGAWVGPCQSSDTGSSRKSYKFSGNKAEMIERGFSDVSCLNERSLSIASVDVVFENALTSPPGATAFNFTASKIMLTFKTDSAVLVANSGISSFDIPAICGGGFVVNQARELNKTNCASDLLYARYFAVSYSIFKIDGDKLFIGKMDRAHDGTSVSMRPIDFEETFFTKGMDENPTGGGSTGGGTTDPGDGSVASINLYQGTWLGSCTTDSSGWNFKQNIIVTGSSWKIITRYFTDNLCQDVYYKFEHVVIATLGSRSSTVAGAYDLMFTPSTLDIIPRSADAVNELNGLVPSGPPAACGGGFVIDVMKSFTADDCISDANYSPFFNTNYDVVKVDGTRLQWGLTGDAGTSTDGLSPGHRPVALDPVYFTKQ